MILAYLNGDLISVRLLHKQPIATMVLIDDDGKKYPYNVRDKHRKLFSGVNSVYDAIEWIEQQNGITIHGIN
jgi:hypothetical protein